MRTRIFNQMLAHEVEEYLARGGDTIFLAMGVTECHGVLPINCETICPEAYAVLMAEKVDGLAMINMPYFYPGGTVLSNATVHRSVREGADFLMGICHSLVNQGFKRIFVISGHGPSPVTVDAASQDFFEETLIHITHIMSAFIGKDMTGPFLTPGKEPNYMMYGAYRIMGQENTLPILPDAPESLAEHGTVDPAVSEFSRLYAANGGHACQVYDDPIEHGGGIIFRSEEERARICALGEEQMRRNVDNSNIVELHAALEKFQNYVQETYKKYPRIKVR